MPSVKVAIDVMSGDHGPSVVLKGTANALHRHGNTFEPILCGDQQHVQRQLSMLNPFERSILGTAEIEHCPESIDPQTEPSKAWTEKKRSSVVRCIALQKEGLVSASVSAGDTGVLMSAAIFMLGRTGKYRRPALAAFLPTARKRPSLLLDVGANVSCRAEHLVMFADMGTEYFQKRYEHERPSIRLLNVGKEPRKGTAEIREADAVLRRERANYAGFIEGSEVLQGAADIIVCDGFAGNVLLKTCEAIHRLLERVFDSDSAILNETKKSLAPLNPDNYGGAPLLGIEGVVCKAHGSSSAAAIANAILLSVEMGISAGQGNSIPEKGTGL